MHPLRIAYVTSEVAPYVKTGGLADVSAALPQQLAALGHDVRVMVPLYASTQLNGVDLEPVDTLQNIPMVLGPHTYHYSVFRRVGAGMGAGGATGAGAIDGAGAAGAAPTAGAPGVADAASAAEGGAAAAAPAPPAPADAPPPAATPSPRGGRAGGHASPHPAAEPTLYFIHCPALYNRQGVYTNDGDEPLRFVLLSRAALDICQLTQWAPEIIHCHDWQTALIPLYLRTLYAWDRLFERTRTLFTIHNLGYQGVFTSQILRDIGLADHAGLLYQEDLAAGVINFLKTGLLYAGMLSTVSPTYAREIQTEAHGFGLHPILSARWESLVGILNGVDYHEWDPATDTKIAATYTRKSLPDKLKNKEALLSAMGLPYDAEAPVFGIVSRLAHQKGFELIGEALPGVLQRHPARLVVLGSGEGQYEEMFAWLQRTFPHQVAFYRGYNDGLSHLIEAGSDMFLMPSRYEPCGLNQMYSLRYGTIPIVRNTGGLADTVRLYEPVSGEGTGFVFDHFNADGLRWAMEFALSVWPDKKAWRKLQRAGMACDYSWEHQGRLYVELYRRMAGR